MESLPNNTTDSPYTILMDVNDLGGQSGTTGSIGATLRLTDNANKFVNLDMSGSTITSIGSFAFSSCTNLINITIPSGVMTIDDRAFSGCTNLTSVTFAPDSQLTTIGIYAFSGATAIDSIEIPKSVTTMVVQPGIPFSTSSIFWGWTASQTIIILGHPSQTSADAAWGGPFWREGSFAVIQYTEQ